MKDKQRNRVVNLLLVVDETDYAKMYMHQIISAVSSVRHAPSVGRASLLDTEGAKHMIVCGKVVFLVDEEVQAFQYAVKPWIENLKSTDNNSPEFLVFLHGELGDDTFGIPKTNIVGVDDLKNFEQWWPEFIRFVFRLYRTDFSVYCEMKRALPLDTPDVIQLIFTRSKKCLEKCNVKLHDGVQGARTVLTCASRGVHKDVIFPLKENTSRRVIATEDSELHKDLNSQSTTTFIPVETLKCILFILEDLGMVNRKREYMGRFLRVLIKLLAITIFLLNLPAYITFAIPGAFAYFCCSKDEFLNFTIVLDFSLSFWIISGGFIVFIFIEFEVYQAIFLGTIGFAYFFCYIFISGVILVRRFKHLKLGIFEVPIALWKYTD